jgi:hypothetical protein
MGNPYEGYKLYGPYTHWRSKRKLVYLRKSKDDKIFYLNLARYVMEMHLGRRLTHDEDVHHLNEDVTDDRLENLEVRHRSLHNSEHAKAKTKRDCFGHWTEQS